MKNTKIQWHPAFVAAMGLELKQNRGDLIFEKEYNLNTKPLEIDLLIIKKAASVQVSSEIGRFFKGHNILEYKSPEDHLDIDTFYKTLAYGCLYKSYGKTVDAIKAEDITISVIREAKPVELFHYFERHGCTIVNTCCGIYCIEGKAWFPTQIVVTNELDRDVHEWLMALSGKLNKEDVLKLLNDRNSLTEKQDRELADSVLEVSIGANSKIVEELLGDESMCETLMEIMEPQIQLREKAALKKGIQVTVKSLKDFGISEEDIRKVIIKNYGLSERDVEEYL